MANFNWGSLFSPNSNLLSSSDIDKLIQSIQYDSQINREREDTAYQRMVKDMQKAGLNPWTGISSGGSQTSQINPSLDSFNGLISALGMNIQNKALNYSNFWKYNQTMSGIMDYALDFAKALGDTIRGAFGGF